MTDSMSDEEIRENLLNFGQNIGPVVDSTRAFYRRKLAKLLGEIKDEPEPRTSDMEGSASEEEANEEEEHIPEEHVQEELFSQSYVPPVQIRGRRSTNSYSGRSPPKASYTSIPSNSESPPTVGKGNIVMLLCLLLGTAFILYIVLFHGGSSKTAVETK